jgi:hypothetical protein
MELESGESEPSAVSVVSVLSSQSPFAQVVTSGGCGESDAKNSSTVDSQSDGLLEIAIET